MGQVSPASQVDEASQVGQVEQDEGCTLSGSYIQGTDVSKCSSVVIDSLSVPAGVTLDLSNMTTGAQIQFQGTTTFGQKVRNLLTQFVSISALF